MDTKEDHVRRLDQFKAVIRELLERFDILKTGEFDATSINGTTRDLGSEWVRLTINVRPKIGTWEQALGALIPLLRGNDETLTEDDLIVATKLVGNVCFQEEKKLNELYSHEHPDQQEKDEHRFQEGVVAGAHRALDVLKVRREPQKCCPEPKVRGGRCDSCGTWIADRDEDWNDKVVHCLEMIVKALKKGQTKSGIMMSSVDDLDDIEDFIVNHLGRD